MNRNLTDGVVLMVKIAPCANGKFPIWHPIRQMGVAQEVGQYIVLMFIIVLIVIHFRDHP